jgi:hypothetical protein
MCNAGSFSVASPARTNTGQVAANFAIRSHRQLRSPGHHRVLARQRRDRHRIRVHSPQRLHVLIPCSR